MRLFQTITPHRLSVCLFVCRVSLTMRFLHTYINKPTCIRERTGLECRRRNGIRYIRTS